jgi:quercetin dioxygenase-like cupin family protein/alkylhydroperoxidase/carboxymuconolactone decarboxylase family protein YurZ
MKKLVTAIIGILLLSFNLNAQNMNTLDSKQQQIVCISAFTATGDLENLKTALNSGLDTGLTVNEVKEILVQMYAYTGFPRSLNAINTLIAVLEERKAKGISDETGEIPNGFSDKNKYAKGKQTIETLSGRKETELTGANAFAPAIDEFLKEHLFADIFGRGVLTYEQRELATVSALSALQNVGPQLNAHKFIGKNVGLTDGQLNRLLQIVQNGQHKQMIDARQMIFRISEIEIYPQYLDEYMKEAGEVGEISVNSEAGVICIYPMQVKRDKNQIRIVEIYSDGQAYNQHIQSAHFQKYKQGTLHMVKSLDLVDTDALNPQMAGEIFNKVQAGQTSVYPKGNRAPVEWFSGIVWLNSLVNPAEIEELYSIGQVTFEAAARTHWHTHPAGQILLCTGGKGWYQERGKPARALKKGDTVVIPKDVEHWHGAVADTQFVHIAVTNNKNGSGVTWLNPVTNEEYNKLEY